MGSSIPIELEGFLSLEGPLLEAVFALHLMSQGYRIVPRRSSYGVHHDILVDAYDGYVFYECTGQEEITVEKIDKFRHDALLLKERLEDVEGKTLKKCVFVAAVGEDSWTARSRDEFNQTVERLKEVGCDVELIQGMDLLKQLLLSGSLGLRLYLNRVFFAGPEDYAIRFDRDYGGFRIMYPKISLDIFRGTPFSSLPSHYWELYHQYKLRDMLQREYAELKEPLWTYQPYEGLKWKSVQDLVSCYKEYLSSRPREYALNIEGEDNWLFSSWKSRRGNRYYDIHAFTTDEVIDRSVADSICGRADMLIHKLKKEGRIPQGEKVSVNVHTFTEFWTSGGWSAYNEKMGFLEEQAYLYTERGNEVLVKLLNGGVLGIRFRKKNLITLCGPNIPAIRLTWDDQQRKYTLETSTEARVL